MMNVLLAVGTFVLMSLSEVQAFQGTTGTYHRPTQGMSVPVLVEEYHCQHPHRRQFMQRDTRIGMSSSMTMELEQFLQQEHSMFYALLLDKNEDVWKRVRDNIASSGACTIFAPTNTAFQALGEKKVQQLQDNRNEEVRNKIGSYHIVLDDSVVTTEQLYNSGGIRTMASGDNPIVPVERSKPSGGNIFAMFMSQGNNPENDDGTVVLGSNNARITNSIYLQNSNTLIHQIDALISPNILWRYCDQLRIPGSK